MRLFFGKIILMVSGVLIAILVGEVLLRVTSPQVLQVHPPGLYTADPDVGYVLTPSFQGELVQSEFKTAITTNAAGLRGPELRPVLPNTKRILLLGDSQTWGYGVNDDETYAVHLEKLLADRYPSWDIQVLNGGVPGYGTADQLHFLESRATIFQPDRVVVQFLSVNDLRENRAPANTWAIIVDGMLGHSNPAESINRTLPLWEKAQMWFKQHSHLARLVFDVVGYWAMRAGLLGNIDAMWGEDFTAEDKELGISYLVAIADTAAAHEASTLFLYTTGQVHIFPDTYEAPRSATVVEEAAAQAGVKWVDASAILSQHPAKETLYFAQNGHWTTTGHIAIAEILANTIIEQGLLE
jgi:lysophospholipase L1-like esterase